MATPTGGSTPIEGRYGRFQVNGENANIEQFTADLSTERIPITGWEDQVVVRTNAATGPVSSTRVQQRVTDGVDKCVARIKGYVDSDNMPANYGFIPGTYITSVYLYLDKEDDHARVTMPTAMVFRVNYQVQVKDKIMFDLEIESHGGPVIGPS